MSIKITRDGKQAGSQSIQQFPIFLSDGTNIAAKTKIGSPRKDAWVKQLGLKERITLPSGTVLLGGEAAKKSALDIARKAWQPDEDHQLFYEADSQKKLSQYHSLLELLTYDDATASEEDRNRIGIYKAGKNRLMLLGVYGNILIMAQESELNPGGKQSARQIAANKVKLLNKTVRSFEEGARIIPEGRDMLAAANATHYPLIVRATDKAEEEISGETEEGGITDENATQFSSFERDGENEKVRQNYDYLVFNTRKAILTNNKKLVPVWTNLFHEIGHLIVYNQARNAFIASFKGQASPFPKGHAILNNSSPDKIRDEDYVINTFDIPLAQKARVNHRATYTDQFQFVEVDDPVNPKPLRKRR